MSFHENIKLLRNKEGLSQEEMAEKLGYKSINGYAKVERGESMPNKENLKKIAEILEMDLETLLGSENNHIVNIKGNNHHYHSVILLSETQCAHELENARLLLQERDKEIEHLKSQNDLLKEMNALLKKNV